MKKVSIILLSVFTVLFFISCGSKPAAEETKPEAPNLEQIDENVTDTNESSIESIIAKIDNARSEAVNAGAEELAPDQLKLVDELYESMKNKNTLKDNSQLVIDRYNLLKNYCKAVNAKKEIDENGFIVYARKNYDEGLKNLEKVEKALANEEEMDSSVVFAAENAYKSFNTVLIVAYKKLAKEQREYTYEAKKNADSVKAGVAQKERYAEAADKFQKGDASYAMQNPKRALELYIESEEDFLNLYNDVYEQRAAAQAALDAAKQRVAESAKYAEDADVRNPITEQVDGIEEEDTVLLEEDNYAAPEEAEADIAEALEEDEVESLEIEETDEESEVDVNEESEVGEEA